MFYYNTVGSPPPTHTHLEFSQKAQPSSAKSVPISSTTKASSPVRSNKHHSATPKHLELIKPWAPPTEHPTLAIKKKKKRKKRHIEINTTLLILRVNSPAGRGCTVCKERVAFRKINRYIKKKRSPQRRKKILLRKKQPKRFQNVSFCLQPHAWRWLPDVKVSCCFDWALIFPKASCAKA